METTLQYSNCVLYGRNFSFSVCVCVCVCVSVLQFLTNLVQSCPDNVLLYARAVRLLADQVQVQVQVPALSFYLKA